MGSFRTTAIVLADLGADVIRVDRAIAGQFDVPESLHEAVRWISWCAATGPRLL